MNILIRQAIVVDPASPFHLQKCDILVQQGIIKSIGQHTVEATTDTQVVSQDGLMVSAGWVDVFAHIPDPGFEYKETLETATLAAAAGGYTNVFSLPNTAPVMHNKAAVEYVVHKTKHLPVTVQPIGAATKTCEGKELAEMYDMHQSGAVAFGDGTASIQPAGIMLKALQYLKRINAVLIQLPNDRSLSGHGLMNESVLSTRLGLSGSPAIAEELMIQRDLELTRYAGSRIHFTGITSARSLELIREAKAANIDVTCSVSPQHLFFCEDDLHSYDTNLKFVPPLRSARDREALQQAVLDGTVDCIASHHQPHEKDGKVVEFEYAQPGVISLETAMAAVCTAIPQISAERLVELFCTAPRKIFNLPMPSLAEGAIACFTLFNPKQQWRVESKNLQSISRNTPYEGMTLQGKPLGIIAKDNLFLNT